MSDEQFDDEMRAAARAARAEVERGVRADEVEAALDDAKTGGQGYVWAGSNAAASGGSRRTWFALAAAASVVALVVGTAYVLLGDDDQIASDTTPTTQATVPVAPTVPGPATTAPTATTTATAPATTVAPIAPSTTAVEDTIEDEEATVTTMAVIPEPIIVNSLDELPKISPLLDDGSEGFDDVR